MLEGKESFVNALSGTNEDDIIHVSGTRERITQERLQ